MHTKSPQGQNDNICYFFRPPCFHKKNLNPYLYHFVLHLYCPSARVSFSSGRKKSICWKFYNYISQELYLQQLSLLYLYSINYHLLAKYKLLEEMSQSNKLDQISSCSYFFTLIVVIFWVSHVFVAEPPEWRPKLVSDRSWYGVGSSLRATCAVPPAHPPANITFALNGREVRHFK